MSENTPNIPEITPEEEAKLVKMAGRRTAFKKHLAVFILLNAFLWVVWYFLFKNGVENTFLKAILFVLIVWLLVIIMHYLIVYKWTKSYKEKELMSLKKLRLQQLREIESMKADMAGQETTESDEPEEEVQEEAEHKNPNFID